MATPHLLIPSLLPFCLSFLLTLAFEAPPPFLLPLSKHPTVLQYLATSYFDPGHRPVELVLDLGGPSTSIRCSSRGFTRPVPCRSIPCLSARVHVEGVDNDSNVFCWDGGSACGVRGLGELVAGDAAFGLEAALLMPNFLYGCPADMLLSGTVKGVDGYLGLGRSSRVSLPFQVAASFGTSTRFSLCLSSSHGVLILGSNSRSNSPLYSAISESLTYAPLVTAFSRDYPHDYLINLSSINVDGFPLSSNATSPPYLARLSTTIPYTTIPTPLYKAFSATFLNAATSAGMKLAKAVRPFGLCFEMGSEGQAVPAIELVLQSTMVRWTIHGRNSMVRADDRVVCLGIVDGGFGSVREDEVVLGGHQLEDVLIEFDFGRSMLGFSPSMRSRGTSCEELALNLASNDLSKSLIY